MEKGIPAVSLIIPAHNDRLRMAARDVLARYHRALADRFGDAFEMIVVANACHDDTAQWIDEQRRNLSHLRQIALPIRGKGSALIAGFRSARGNAIAFADADGAASPHSLVAVINALADADAVIGSRYSAHSTLSRRQPPARRAIGRAARLLIRTLFPFRFDDMLCGCKAFRREAIDAILPTLSEPSAAIDIDILDALTRMGFSIREVPIQWEHVDSSKMALRKMLGWPFALLRIRFSQKRAHNRCRDNR